MSAARELLERRARQLARPLVEGDVVPTARAVLVSVGNGRRYVLEAAHVREICRNEHLRRLPAGSGALLGLIPSRGGVVPVADLAHLLGVSAPDRTRPVVVVVDGEQVPALGLLVDEASDVVDVPVEQLHAIDPNGAGAESRVQLTAQGAVVLSASQLLLDPRLTAARASLGTAPVPQPEPPIHHDES